MYTFLLLLMVLINIFDIDIDTTAIVKDQLSLSALCRMVNFHAK